jgi:hypothetical protein
MIHYFVFCHMIHYFVFCHMIHYFVFCHMIHYFVKKSISVSACLDTSEDTKGTSFLLLWSEMLRCISFPNLFLECPDMTHAEFLLHMPFDE